MSAYVNPLAADGKTVSDNQWPGGDFAGNAIGWELASELWAEMGLDDVGLNGRALAAACFTLIARHNQRRGSDVRPEGLLYLLDEDEARWKYLLEGEQDPTMLHLFADDGTFCYLSQKARAEHLGPFVRQLSARRRG